MKDKKPSKQDQAQEQRTSDPIRYGLDSPYLENNLSVPNSENSVQDEAVRFKLLSQDTYSLDRYEAKLEDLLIRTRNRIKHVKDGRRDYLTINCLNNLERFYSRAHSICESVSSEREDSIFGMTPPLEYSQPFPQD